MKIMLNKEHLTDLMKGKILDFQSIGRENNPDIQITLTDMGFDLMRKSLGEALNESGKKEEKDKLLKHNQIIMDEIESITSKIENYKGRKKRRKKHLISLIKPPCVYCPYDGDYRCKACEEDYYVGFNIIDYPRQKE